MDSRAEEEKFDIEDAMDGVRALGVGLAVAGGPLGRPFKLGVLVALEDAVTFALEAACCLVEGGPFRLGLPSTPEVSWKNRDCTDTEDLRLPRFLPRVTSRSSEKLP